MKALRLCDVGVTVYYITDKKKSQYREKGGVNCVLTRIFAIFTLCFFLTIDFEKKIVYN